MTTPLQHAARPAAAQADEISLVQRHREPLIRYFVRRGVAKISAEDLAQDCFRRLFGLKGRDHIENPDAYLFQIAASVFTDHVRVSRSHFDSGHVALEETPGAEVLNPERVLEGREAFARLRIVLGELKPKTREIFLLNRLDGLSYTQIAVRYGLTPSAIEKHMMTALAHLHKRMNGWR
ncbi:MAG: sigma-70 family RNA polymerase sigma factor [Alphaproteobacteria bacterium]